MLTQNTYTTLIGRPYNHITKVLSAGPKPVISMSHTIGVCGICAGIHNLRHIIADIMICDHCQRIASSASVTLDPLLEKHAKSRFNLALTQFYPILALERIRTRYMMSLFSLLTPEALVVTVRPTSNVIANRCHICYADAPVHTQRYCVSQVSMKYNSEFTHSKYTASATVRLQQCDICDKAILDHKNKFYANVLLARAMLSYDCYCVVLGTMADLIVHTILELGNTAAQ